MSGGFDFWIYALRFAGDGLPDEWRQPLVARVPPSATRYPAVTRESQLQAWASENAYSAPAVLTVTAPGDVVDQPVQVVARVPGRTMDTAMTAKPWRIPRLAGELGTLQAQLHAVPVPDFARSSEWSILDKRLSLVHVVLAETNHPGLRRGLTRLEPTFPALVVDDPVLCHGDFHPRNVLVAAEGTTVIDWTDAGVGDRHCDIARTAWLFGFAAAAAPSRVERTVVRVTAPLLANCFLAGYRRHHPVDAERVRRWLPVHLLHAWAMFVADERELFAPSRAGTDYRTGMSAWAEQQFDRALREVA